MKMESQTIVTPKKVVKPPSFNEKKYFILYLVLFYLAWSLTRLFWLNPDFGTVTAGLLEASFKSAIWVIPVFVYLKKLDQLDPFAYLKLNKKPKDVIWTVGAIFITALLLYILNHLLTGNEFVIATGFSRWLNVVLLAGLVEEIVFRGFILQKIVAFMKFYKANLLTALLFLLMHFPIWIATGLSLDFFVSNSLKILILGLITGYLFKRSGSLWTAIAFHTAYNLLITLGF